jgi:8-amino-7-oxononanoate synthase
MQHAGVRDPGLLVASSLAKAFGVPLAVLSGSEAMISEYQNESQTRMHCSPPSVAVVAAAIHALKINQNSGDSLRMRLAQGVARFRGCLSELNLLATNSLFPLQPLRLPQGIAARAIHETLLRRGVRTALQGGARNAPERISFVITAQHGKSELDYAAMCLRSAMCLPSTKRSKGGINNGSAFQRR